jgi:segregation and condensation protein B
MIEALLFASDSPLAASDFCRIDERLDEDTVSAVIEELRAEYDREERSFQIFEIAGGFQLLTRPEYAAVLERFDTVPQSAKLSVPALEVLAIVAYRQPLGRAEVEEIRGVQSSAVLRTLLDRELIETVGRSEGLGRPMLYGTTRKFLEHFGFRSLEDLPRPDELPIVLRAVTLDAAVETEPPTGASTEPTPLSPDAATEAEVLHIPVPEPLRSALEHHVPEAEASDPSIDVTDEPEADELIEGDAEPAPFSADVGDPLGEPEPARLHD